MANGISRIEELEADVKQLNHRMYQVEDAVKTLQEEIAELKQDVRTNELSSQRR